MPTVEEILRSKNQISLSEINAALDAADSAHTDSMDSGVKGSVSDARNLLVMAQVLFRKAGGKDERLKDAFVAARDNFVRVLQTEEAYFRTHPDQAAGLAGAIETAVDRALVSQRSPV